MLNAFHSNQRFGIDPEPNPIIPNVNFVQADGTRLPFNECTFGSVICLDTIEHVEDDQSLADELLRVLAPNGCLRVTTPSQCIR